MQLVKTSSPVARIPLPARPLDALRELLRAAARLLLAAAQFALGLAWLLVSPLMMIAAAGGALLLAVLCFLLPVVVLAGIIEVAGWLLAGPGLT